MHSCAFFGHSNFDYDPYKEKIRERIIDLIENRGVTEFYSGGRGKFENMCSHLVWELREKYPNIKNILVLSYIPSKKFDLFFYYDESVYLLEKKVPYRFAISHTNRKLVETVDYIISGVTRSYGGAKAACDYAKRLYKTMFYVVSDQSYCDYDWVQKHVEEQMQDDQFHLESIQKAEQLIERLKSVIDSDKTKSNKK